MNYEKRIEIEIEMTAISNEYKLHYLLRNYSNPIFSNSKPKPNSNSKSIATHEKDIYEYYNLLLELIMLCNILKFRIISYYETQDKKTYDYVSSSFYLFPEIKEVIISTHRDIKKRKKHILENWELYNPIITKYIIEYG